MTPLKQKYQTDIKDLSEEKEEILENQQEEKETLKTEISKVKDKFLKNWEERERLRD